MTPDPTGVPPERVSRARDVARVLPWVGAFLLLPPVIAPFTSAEDVAGVPLVVVYLCTVWLGLIVAAARLSRALAPGSPEDSPPSA
ncbi:MAG: hypothetical protein ACREVQ_15265 [Burkholderiales bacterium]